MSSLGEVLLGECAERLAGFGFERRDHVFISPASPEVLLWIGLSPTSEPNFVSVNPMIGLRHEALENVYIELLNVPQSDAATVARQLATIEDIFEPYSWACRSTQGASELAGRLVEDIRLHGLPYVLPRASLAGVIELLSYEGKMLDESERLAVAHALVGDEEAARSELEFLLAEDPEFEMAFIEAFGRRFGISVS